MESAPAPLTRIPTLIHEGDREASASDQSPTVNNSSGVEANGPNPSRVNLGYFDNVGVENLREVIPHQPTEEGDEKGLQRTHSHVDSDITLTGILPADNSWTFEQALRQIVRRIEHQNIQRREMGVAFRNLDVLGVAASNSFQPTLGTLLNPLNMLEELRKLRHPPVHTILKDFEGVVRPGEMLLVLGSPGSGCTTLLKTLANMRGEYLAVNGEVYYDSLTSDDIKNHFRGDVQYCAEDDTHFPTLTVQQTLDFAAKTRTPQTRGDMSRKGYVHMATEILTTVFGLRHAKDTPVGDAAIRGVSGGEKKRVSIAETLSTKSAIGAWDNSTRGLDASTALEFVRALRIATDTFNVTTILSLYQAGEPLYEYFDKVCVIYEGRMAYFGPANKAKQYFIDMGFKPANRQTTADFLVAVTDPMARTARPGTNTPRTAEEFAAYFEKSDLGRANQADIEDYMNEFVGKPKRVSAYINSARAERAKFNRKSSPYTISIPMQTRAVMLRRVQILRGNMLATGLNLFSFIFQSLIMGSVYFQSPEETSAFFSRGGVMFFAIFFVAVSTLAEIPALYAQRPIVLKHKNAALYHPFVEALALTLVDIPITFTISALFGIILYFMVGLQRTAGQFFIFFLFLFTTSITMRAWFRAIAAAFKSEAAAQSFAGVSILVLAVYTGYTIPKPSMIGALRWLTYINPFRYSFEAMLTNEFRTLKAICTNLVPQGPAYQNVSLANQVCAVVGAQPGEDFVDGNRFVELSYGYSFANGWKDFGIILAFGIGFIIALLTLTEIKTSSARNAAIVLFKRGSDYSIPKKADEEAPIPEKVLTTSEGKTQAGSSASPSIVLPSSSIFTWQGIDYTVPIHGGEHRRLLSDVSGYVAPGKLTALMGESGAGKTTLLNVLAERVSVGVVTGDRFVNGSTLPTDFRSQTGYCQQMDTHLPTTTVREALLFSAKLRQPPSIPLSEKEDYVEKCLELCGLSAYADAIVGSLGVEHRKRTTIAVELAAKPQLLLFVDEPTSGLDSQSAWSIMAFLRSLADSGQAILCTIHQPSAELFQIFDRLLLLKKGGETVYFGDVGHHATTLIDYFERNGSRSCHSGENPAEFMLEVIGAGATATSVKNWHQIWKDAPESQVLRDDIERIHSEGRSKPSVVATLHTDFATSWFTQTKELLWRNLQAYWRDPTYIIAKLILNVVGGLFIGFTFFKAKNTQQGTTNKLFAIFLSTILCVPLANQLQVPFIHTRTIYEIRERPSRMYSWTALVTAQLLAELPWNIFGSSLYFLCWYWTIGFDNSRAGYTYLMFAVIFPLYYTSIGQAVAAMSPSPEIAAILFSFLFSFVVIFNGVLQPFSQLGWWKWMYHLSPFTYLVEGLLGQAIGRQELQCSAIELVALNPPTGQTCGQYMAPFIQTVGGYLTNPEALSACKFCAVKSSDQYLANNFNIFYSNRWRDVGIMVAFVAFNIICIYLFTYLFRIRTGSILSAFRKRTKKNH